MFPAVAFSLNARGSDAAALEVLNDVFRAVPHPLAGCSIQFRQSR
jgi:hypothetical protein